MTDVDVTRILARLSRGEEGAADALVPLLYDELRAIASRQIREESRPPTLQPTALVHEAYLKLLDHQNPSWKDRQHFLAFAARVMRRVLVDAARARNRQKRGGGQRRITLSDLPGTREASAPVDVLDLEEALERLNELQPRHARVLELRFFSELGTSEIAEVLEVSDRTVKRDWKVARAWLQMQLES